MNKTKINITIKMHNFYQIWQHLTAVNLLNYIACTCYLFTQVFWKKKSIVHGNMYMFIAMSLFLYRYLTNVVHAL